MNLPLITIGICCYNSEDTVARAINSALSQDWPNFEVVIIDDGSSDNTVDVIKKSIQEFPNAQFIKHKENLGFSGALNTVIEVSRGEYIAIFDDDDESTPDRLSIQYRTHTQYEKENEGVPIVCYGSGLRVYPNGYNMHFKAIGSEPNVPVGMSVADRTLFYGLTKGDFYGNGTPSCSLFIRKSVYELVGPYDLSMFRSEDADFVIRLGLKGGHFIGCKETVLKQYFTGSADKSAQRVYDSYDLLLEKYKDYLLSKGRYGYAKGWNLLRFHHFSGNRLKALKTLFCLFLRYPWWTFSHFMHTAPKRLLHEKKMRQETS